MKVVLKPLGESADASRGLESRNTQLKNILYVIVFFVGLYFLLGAVGNVIGAHIPDSWERGLANVVVDEESPEADLPRCRALMDQLTQGESLRALNYRLFLLDMDEPNAVAVPGGAVGVTQGLLDVLEADPALAFVLAHELGHHQHRHITERLGRGLILGLAGSLIGHQSSITPVDSAWLLAETKFSREQETEADLFAVDLVYRKLGTVEGVTDFFEHIDEIDDENVLQRYVGSHPLSADRIKALKTRMKELERSSDLGVLYTTIMFLHNHESDAAINLLKSVDDPDQFFAGDVFFLEDILKIIFRGEYRKAIDKLSRHVETVIIVESGHAQIPAYPSGESYFELKNLCDIANYLQVDPLNEINQSVYESLNEVFNTACSLVAEERKRREEEKATPKSARTL